MKKVIIIGCPGSGKTTFAKKLNRATGLPLYHLDAIWHKPDRTHIPREEFDSRIGEIFAESEWIIDGNYSRTIEMRLKECDTVFFFDLPTEICLDGAACRIGKSRTDMPWTETELDPEFRAQIESFSTKMTPIIYNLPEKYGQNREVVVFKSREEADKYINSIESKRSKIDSIISKELIQKGWSEDKKYRAVDSRGRVYLLRISFAEQYERKKNEFAHMQEVAALGVRMCVPIEFGICDDGVYSIQGWIDGEDAEAVLPSLSEDEQYAYGYEAGQMLKKIHSIPAPPETEKWSSRFNKKIDRKIKNYTECPIKYDRGQLFIDYINSNRHLLTDSRPMSYQHGDYHVGNMMIGKDGRLYIIDFNRDDFGDPWEEFNRIVWCAKVSPEFACGMVDGYFDGKIPIEFWQTLALYIASNCLSSLPWAIPFGDGEIEVMKNQAADVLEWYDNMTDPIPSWYYGRNKKGRE